MSWSFVGAANNTVNSGTTLAVSLPAGVQGGDLVVIAACMTGSGATCTVSVPGFTTVPGSPSAGGAKPSGSFTDQFWVGTHTAGGTAGSATTDTGYTATFNESAFAETLTYVLRSTLGSWTVVGGGKYNGNAASSYLTACPDAVYTPTSASNATIWGYAGQNAALGTTATTFTGTGPTALSNFSASSSTNNGGGIGAGWIQSVSAPGGATANQAVDATDFAAEFAESASAGAVQPQLPQRGGSTWRRRFRRVQTQVPPVPVPTSTAVTVTGYNGSPAGTNLKVLVLTGATEAGGAQVANSGISVAPNWSLTPNFSNSLIAFGIYDEVGGTSGEFTASANNTLIDNSIQNDAFCDGRYSGTVTAGTPVTVGCTAPTTTTNEWVSYEVPASGGSTPSIDASTPAVVKPLANTAVTAVFSPPSGAVLVAITSGNNSSVDGAISDTAGLTWTKRSHLTNGSGGSTVLWTATWPGAGAVPPPPPPAVVGQAEPDIPWQNLPSPRAQADPRQMFVPWPPWTDGAPPPATTVTVNAGLATGTGAASAPGIGITAGLATGTGAASSPAVGITVVLATGTGAAPAPAVGLTPGLASGTGAANAPNLGLTPGLATGTGTAGGISIAGAALTRVQHNGMGTSTTTAASLSATLGLGVTSGNLLIATIVVGTNVGTVTPPAGWTQAGPTETVTSFLQTQIFYLVVGTGGATSFTFSWTGLHSFGWTIEEWHSATGWPASPVDITSGATPTTTAINCGSPSATTQATELWYGVLSWSNSGQTLSGITSGWSTGDSATFTSNNTQTAFFQIASATGTPTLAATLSAAQSGEAGVAATFKVAAGAVTAGLATAAGTAFSPSAPRTAGLATGTGTASAPGIGITAGLATAAGTAFAPAVGITAGLATAAGTAGGISQAVNSGLATAAGTSFAPAAGLTPGLATGTGTAGGISVVVNAGLATAAGNAFAPAVGITPALATATGTASGISVRINAGLATGTGTAFAPAVGLTPGLATGTGTAGGISVRINAGLATGTGTAFNITVQAPGISAGLATAAGTAGGISIVVNAGLATAAGTALAPAVGLTPGLATGTGPALAPTAPRTAGLATGTGTAFGVSAQVNAGLATGTGTAFAPAVGITARLATAAGTSFAPSAPRTAGLATGTGTAFAPSAPRTAGLATGTGTAFNAVHSVRQNVDYTGSTLVNPNTLGGTVAVAALGGTLAVTANTLTGTLSTVNTLGGTASVATLDGTLAVTSDTHTGTLSVAANTFSGTTVEDKMQEVDIILNEFNDATVTFQILNNASPMNITGMTVNALFKKTRGDLDSALTTKTYSSGGGSPLITIVTPTTGSCSLAIPDADVIFPNWTFYRIDVVNGTVTTTAIFGTVTITQL